MVFRKDRLYDGNKDPIILRPPASPGQKAPPPHPAIAFGSPAAQSAHQALRHPPGISAASIDTLSNILPDAPKPPGPVAASLPAIFPTILFPIHPWGPPATPTRSAILSPAMAQRPARRQDAAPAALYHPAYPPAASPD